MLSQEEKQIVEFGKSKGKSRDEVLGALSKFRAEKQQPVKGGYTLKDAGGDLKETFLGMGKEALKAGEDIITRDIRKPDENIAERVVGMGADALRGIGRVVSQPYIGAAKLAVPQSVEEEFKGGAEKLGKFIGETQVAQDIINEYNSLDPQVKAQVDNVLGYLEGASEIYTAGLAPRIARQIMRTARDTVGTGAEIAGRAVASGTGSATDAIRRGVTTATQKTTEALGDTGQGVIQSTKEFLGRGPRAVRRAGEALEDAAQRAERIRNATPTVKNAIESGLDERFINTVAQADAPTQTAYKEMVDLASETPTTIKPRTQPSIVAGKVAEQTFDVLDAERKRIGKELGDEVAKLPTGTTVNMGPSMRQVRSTLAENGINVTQDGALTFAGKFTKAERARMQELWDTINELPEQMSPAQVRDMDQLLSKLQRETRMEGLGDLRIRVNGEDKSVFGVFRDIYTNQLENLNPRIRQLNREYAQARTLIDDLEDTIFKGGGYDSIKGIDQAEFAKTNLRRIMGEAQSSPAYAEILKRMDARARELGYTGARADELIYFAEELRKLFPETIPKTGFQGGIRTGVMDLVERVSTLGRPTTVDQQRALKALLDALATQ